MKVTEYKLSAPHAFSHGPQDTITLPQGAFVKPLQHQYVPQHILNKSENMGYNTKTHTFVYTRHGIVLVPLSIIIEA